VDDESDVVLDEVDELDTEDDELGVEDVEPEVEEELEEAVGGFVGVADELADVDELPAVTDDDDEEESLFPRSDAIPETTELTPPPCRLWKMFTSNQLACVRASRSARIASRRT